MTELVCIDADIAATVRLILISGCIVAGAIGGGLMLLRVIESRWL